MFILKKYLAAFNPKERFNRDVSWNIISLGLVGVIGLGNNVLMKSSKGDFGLGIFSILYAIYVITAQLSTGGIQLSIIKSISHNQEFKKKCREIYTSGLITVFFTSSIVSTCLFFCKEPIANFTNNPVEIANGIIFLCPALIFYSLNKVLLSTLNGIRMMRSLAFFQFFRMALLCLSIVSIIILDYPIEYLASSFIFTEFFLFLSVLIFISIKFARPMFTLDMCKWIPEHIRFGSKSVVSGVFHNISVRVDQIMLSYFFDAEVVGIYTFASFFVEGLNEIGHVVRRNVDPIFGALFSHNRIRTINRVVLKIKKNYTPFLVIIFFTALLGFPFLSIFVGFTKSFMMSWGVLGILLIGVFISGRISPFFWILVQGGRPEVYSFITFITVALNIVTNYFLIQLFGIFGAALATALVFMIQAYLIKFFAWKLLKVKM